MFTKYPYTQEVSDVTHVNTPTQRELPNTFTRTRKEKDPDKFDGKATDWRDFSIHFENVASWNGWDDNEKAQQLVI